MRTTSGQFPKQEGLRTTSGQFPKEEGLDKVLGALVRYESELKAVGDDNAALVPHLDALRRVTEQAMARKVSADGARALKMLLANVDAETRRLRLGIAMTASQEARKTLPQEKRTLLNHLPSTGMGKFDAVLDPAAGALVISLRVYYDFAPDDQAKGV